MAKNKIFIQDNSYTATIANGAIAAYSSRDGLETFNIDAGVTGIELDANFEKLSLAGNKNDYNIDFDASGYIAIKLISSGATVVTFPSLNKPLEISYKTQQIAETIEQTSATTLIRNGTTYSATTYTVTPSVTSVEEGNAVTFTVTPSSVSASARTLNYQIKYVAVNSAIATDVNDFTKVTGSVTISANATNTNFPVIPINDGKESFEGFQVALLDSNYVPVAISSSVVVSDAVSTGGMPYTLTTGINKFTGTSSDDSFDASLVSSSATLQSGDTLDGGDGIDTLSAALNAATYYTPTLTSVDIVKITDTAGATLSLAKSTGVTNLESVSSINAPTFLNIANTNVGLKVSGQAVGASFGFTTAAVSGAADSATVTLDGMTAGTLTVDGIETLTLASTGSPNAITTLTTSTASKIVVSGDTNLSTGTLGATVSVVDASVFNANLTTTMGAVTNATVKGGLGDDSITFTAVTGLASIFGGEGNDTIISTINFVATDSIDGGNGTADVLSTNNAIAIALDTGTAPTTYTITNIEQLSIIDELNDSVNALVVANIATGINTVNLKQASNVGNDDLINQAETITGGAGSFTINLGGSAAGNTSNLNGTLTVTDTGTAATDSLILNNLGVDSTTALNINSFNGQSITSTGYESVNINTGKIAAGAAQTINTLTLTSDTVAAPTSLTVTGKNAFTLTSLSTNSTDVVTVDASGLTAQTAGTMTLTISGTTSGTAGKQKIIGSAGEDSITVGNFAATIEGGDSKDTITGGTANDSLLGGDGIDTIDTGNGNNTVNGGNGGDVITAGTGNDSLLGAADDDKFIMGSNLTSADTIDGGTGTNTLTLASLGFASTGFANVSNIQRVGITGTTLVTLSSPISSTAATFDLSSAEAGQLTFASGYTGAVTVLETNGTAHNATNIDVITNTANIALTIKGDVADLNTVNIAGGTATDTIELTADDGAADLTNTSGIDTITILAGATSTKNATITNAVVASGKVLTVNASALTDSTADFSFAAKASQLGSVSVTGGAGVNTINLTNLAGNNTVTGGANDDVITGGTGNDSLSGGAGSDTYTMTTGLTNGDNIVDSTGTTDKLTATINGLTATTGAFNISGVETITLATATAASTIDATGIIGASLLAFTGSQGVTVTKLGAGATVGFGSTGTAYTGIANLSLASSGGIADVLNLKLNTTATQTVGTITTAGIETVNFEQSVVAAANQVLDLSLTAANTITLSASTANGNSRNYTLGTLNTATTLLDASGDLSTGQLIVIGSSTATTFKGSAGANNITGGALGDTITIATAYNDLDTVAGGTGTDTLNATFTVAQTAMDFTKVSAVEIYNLTIDPTLDIVVADSGATGTTGLMDATTTTVNVIGGTTGSFTAIAEAFSTGARFTAGTGTFDASQFGGTVDIAADATGFILGDKYVGGTGTADVLRVLGSTSTFGAVTVSKFETIEFSGTAGNSSFDMTNVTGATNLLLTGTMSQTVTNLAAGVTVSLGANTAQAVNSLADTVADGKTFTIGRIASSTSGTADALTVNLNDEAAITSGMTLVANGIEALTFNQTTVTGKNFSLAINDTNATNPVALTFNGGFATAGTNTTTIRSGGIEANVTSIDASGSSDNFVMATGARAGSTAMTITGGSGSDTLIMKHANDSLTGGAGTSDTLNLVFSTLGGQNTVVDLSAADQVTSLKSISNAAIQFGFESVTAAGITGLGSLDITGSSVANTLTGSLNADLINGGAGDDIIIGGAGADDLTGGTGLDTFFSDNTGTVTTWNIGIDTINDLGTGGRNTTALANAAITGINGDVLKFSNADLAALTGFANTSGTTAYVTPTGTNGTTIKTAALVTGAGAPTSTGATAQFLYNSTDGALYFDADGGAGAAAQVQVAILATGLTLTVTDFLIVA